MLTLKARDFYVASGIYLVRDHKMQNEAGIAAVLPFTLKKSCRIMFRLLRSRHRDFYG